MMMMMNLILMLSFKMMVRMRTTMINEYDDDDNYRFLPAGNPRSKGNNTIEQGEAFSVGI